MSRSERRAALAAMNGQQQPEPELRNLLGLDARRFHPMADQVLLEVELETKRGSIIVPMTAQQQQLAAGGLPLGRVLEVGDKVERVKAGDLVLAPPRDAAKIDVLLWLVPEGRLLAKVDPLPEQRVQSA